MKHLLFLACTLLTCVCHGQDDRYIYHLEAGEKLQGFSDVPFDSITVLDSRFDRSCISVWETSQGKRFFLLDGPLAEKAQSYFSAAVAGTTRSHRHLLLIFRQLREVWGPYGLAAKVDAYAGVDGGGYEKVGTIVQKDHLPFFRHPGGNIYDRTIRHLMSGILAAAIDSCRLAARSGVRYPADSIATDIFHYWERQYPIASSGRLTDGIYYTLQDFQNNRVDARDFDMEREPDSSYDLKLSQPVDRPVWAVCYHGAIFFYFMQQFWLPLSRDSGRFSFYVPTGLAGIETYPYSATGPNAPPSGNQNLAMINNADPGSVEQLHAKQLEQLRRKTLTRELNEMKTRTYYLNLDTGEWALKDE